MSALILSLVFYSYSTISSNIVGIKSLNRQVYPFIFKFILIVLSHLFLLIVVIIIVIIIIIIIIIFIIIFIILILTIIS